MPGGITPITTCGSLFRTIERPTSVGSALKRRPILERRPRHRHLLPGARRFAEGDDPLHVRIRIRAQHDGVGDAEDRGVGADAERERRDDDHGVAGIEAERAGGVLEILPDRGHDGLPSLSQDGWFEGDAALDARDATDEAIGFFGGQRRAMRVGQVLLDFGEDVDAAGRRHPQGGQPRLDRVAPVPSLRHSRGR
jgi:hypothetical protein